MTRPECLAVVQRAADAGDKQAAAWLRGEGRIVITRDFQAIFVRFDNQTERQSPRYPKWRKRVFERDNYTCQGCGTKGQLNAHHVKGWAEFPESRFDVENGLTLCFDCHSDVHPHMKLWKRKTGDRRN